MQLQPRDRDLQFGRLSGSTDRELLRTIRKHRFQRWFYSSFSLFTSVIQTTVYTIPNTSCNISIFLYNSHRYDRSRNVVEKILHSNRSMYVYRDHYNCRPTAKLSNITLADRREPSNASGGTTFMVSKSKTASTKDCMSPWSNQQWQDTSRHRATQDVAFRCILRPVASAGVGDF